MSRTLPSLTPWPAGKPLPAGAITLFYDPATNQEYRVDLTRLSGTPAATELSLAQLQALLVAGDGVTITPTNGGTQLLISSTVVAAVPKAPAAPTAGQVDDTADTFSFLANPLFPAAAQYKVIGRPGVTGAEQLDTTNSYVQGGRIYIKVVGAVSKGGLAVYVAGSGSVPDGQALANNEAFTGAVVPAPGPALTAALAISVASIVAGSPLTFEVTPGGGTAPYSYAVRATNTTTGAVTILGSSATGSFAPQAVGTYNIDATVTDAAGASKPATTRTVQVTAPQSVNQIPVASAGDDLTITLPTSSAALLGAASDPDPGDTLTYLWRQVTGPNSATGLPAASLNVVVSNLVAGTYQFGFQATDNRGGKSSEDFVVVTVQPATTGGGSSQLDAPSGVVVTALSASSLGVSWETVTNASNYKLLRATDAAFTQNITLVYTGGSTSFTDTGLTASATYWYAPAAVGDSTHADSTRATPVSGTTKAATLPMAPGDRGGIPGLNITGSDWGNLTRETKQNVSYAFTNGYGSTYLAGNLPSGAGQVKGAGNYTWTAPKKPFNLYLAAKATELGLPSGKTRRNLAEFNDPTFLRNFGAFDLLRRFGVLAPETRPVELSLDSTYYGLYNYATKPDKVVTGVLPARTLVLQKVLTAQEGDLTALTYFETPYYGTGNYIGPKYAGEQHGISVENPEPADIKPEELAAAKALIARFEASLVYSYDDLVNGPQSVANNESLVSNYLVQEFFKNPDGESASSYMYQDATGKLCFMAWDFDQSAPIYQGATTTRYKDFWTRATPYYAKLFSNGFATAVEAYYQANRPAFVAMIASLQQRAQLLSDTGTAERNNSKWNSYQQDGNKLEDGSVLPTYQQHVAKLLEWLNGRLAWFDVVYGAATYGYVDYLTFTDGDTNRIAVPELVGVRTVRLWFQSAFRDVTRRSILLEMPGVARLAYTDSAGGTMRVNGKSYSIADGLDGIATGEWQNIVLELPQAVTVTAGLYRFFAGKQGRLEFYSGVLTDAQCVAERLLTEAGPLATYNSRVSGALLLDESGNGKDAVLYGTLPQSTRPPVAAGGRSPKPTQGMAFNLDRGGYAFSFFMKAGTYRFMFWMDLRSIDGYLLDLRGGGGAYLYTGEAGPAGPTLYYNQADHTFNLRPIKDQGFTRVSLSNVVVPQDGVYKWLARFEGGPEGLSAVFADFRAFDSGQFTDAELADAESAPTAGLYAQYAMDGPAPGNVVLSDLSGNGNDATLTGF